MIVGETAWIRQVVVLGVEEKRDLHRPYPSGCISFGVVAGGR